MSVVEDTTQVPEGHLIDPRPYTLPIPKLDGLSADRLVLTFGGSIELDRADDHLRLLEGMSLGQDVELVVTARVSGKGFTHSLREDDGMEVDVTGYQVKLKAHSVTTVDD